MRRPRVWRTWRNTKARLALLAALLYAPACAQAQTEPQLQFVKILPSPPGSYGAPVRFGRGESLGVRLINPSSRQWVEFQLKGLVNREPGGSYEKNQTVRLADLANEDFRRRNVAAGSSDLVVPLSSVDLRGVVEVTACLVDKIGARIGMPVKLTLDASASNQAAPSLLKQALLNGSTLLDRLMNIGQNVRQAPEPRFLFALALKNGEPDGAPVRLSRERMPLLAADVSPAGGRVAWVVEQPGHYELWVSDATKFAPTQIVSAPQEIATPRFIDERSVVYVSRASLYLTSVEKGNAPQAIRTPLRSVSRIDWAQRKDAGIECIVSGERADVPGLDLPHLVRFPATGLTAEAFRLPMSPFYPTYSLFVEGSPFFFAGTVNEIEGIHMLNPGDPDVPTGTVYRTGSPGLVAVAANGSRLIFAGSQ